MNESIFPLASSMRLAAFVIGSAIIIFIVNWLLRRLLRVERKEFFSYNHINAFHRKADWTIRWITVGCIILLFIFAYDFFFAGMVLVAILSGLVQESLRALLEKKYAENPNDYLFTLIQMPSTLLIIIGVAWLSLPELFSEMFTNLF